MSYKSMDRRFHNPQICWFLFSIFKVICLERNYSKWSCPLSLPLYGVERRPEMVEPLNHIALFSFLLILDCQFWVFTRLAWKSVGIWSGYVSVLFTH